MWVNAICSRFFLLSIAITVTLVVIIDLDSSRQGLIVVTQEPLIDLQQQLSTHEYLELPILACLS